MGKCKNKVKASERRLTVSIYAQDQLLPFNFVDAQLQCQIEISGILRKTENVRIEDDVVALDEDEYSSCVIDCLDYGDQTTARESAEMGEDVSEEAEVRTSKTRVRTTRSGGTQRPRDQSLYLFYDRTIKYPRLLMTWLINTKDKLLFDTSCTICTAGLHRTHELTKCSGRQLTNTGTK